MSAVHRTPTGFTVHTEQGSFDADAMVLATDGRGLRNLVPENATQDGTAHRLRTQLRPIYPELADAHVQHAEHVLAADCPLVAPGAFPTRPTVTTPDPALPLAGGPVRVDLPVALMERAATTGFAAANALLAQWRVRGHDLWSVSNGGARRHCAEPPAAPPPDSHQPADPASYRASAQAGRSSQRAAGR